MKPRLTAIIPSRNAEATIGRCLESLLAQTLKPEIIVQDALSSDRTVEIARSYGPDIRIFSEKDLGVYDAMNRGISRAKGEWIMFLGADDILADLSALENVFRLKIHPHTKWLFTRVRNTGHTDARIPSEYGGTPGPQLYWRNTLHHQGILYHKSVFDQHRFDSDLRILGDYALNLELYQEKTPWQSCDTLLSICDARGLSKNFGWALYKEEIKLKLRRLPPWAFVLNLIWVPLKFAYKRF